MNGWSLMLDNETLRRLTDERRDRLARQWGGGRWAARQPRSSAARRSSVGSPRVGVPGPSGC